MMASSLVCMCDLVATKLSKLQKIKPLFLLFMDQRSWIVPELKGIKKTMTYATATVCTNSERASLQNKGTVLQNG